MGSRQSREKLDMLGDILEEAYAFFLNQGYTYPKLRNRLPIEVVLMKMERRGREEHAPDGAGTASMWGDDYGWLELNIDLLNRPKDLRLTVGHEFFHIVQDLYDPRNSFSKAKIPSRNYWLREATGAWIEQFFASDPNHVNPSTVQGSADPFGGMYPPEAGKIAGTLLYSAKDHSTVTQYGYGMAFLIEYLADRYGDDIVRRMFEEIRSGTEHPVDVIVSAVGASPEVWLGDFLVEHLQGNIYGVVDQFSLDGGNKFRIESGGPREIRFLVDYRSLGAHTFRVQLVNAQIDPGASLTFSIEPDGYTSMFVFEVESTGIQQRTWKLLGETTSTLKAENLNSFWGKSPILIIALVVNKFGQHPYTANREITINIEVDEPVAGFPETGSSSETCAEGRPHWTYGLAGTRIYGSPMIAELTFNKHDEPGCSEGGSFTLTGTYPAPGSQTVQLKGLAYAGYGIGYVEATFTLTSGGIITPDPWTVFTVQKFILENR